MFGDDDDSAGDDDDDSAGDDDDDSAGDDDDDSAGDDDCGYAIGDIGPGGGVVFYDKGYESDGWQCMEAYPLGNANGAACWGCVGVDLPGASSSSIGDGLSNTLDMLAGCANETTAASRTADFENNGYQDWFVPSKDELDAFYGNIMNVGLLPGGFLYEGTPVSSTEIDATSIWVTNTSQQQMFVYGKSDCTLIYLPVRRF